MAIEGPLKELGIHDVFQLLDLSRKTGVLRVTSQLRRNHGTIHFDRGSVVAARIRSNPHPLGAMLLRAGKITESELEHAREKQQRGDKRRFGEILVDSGAITQPELERHVRLQVEEVIFEVMGWREGYFSFAEGPLSDSEEVLIRVRTEALMMEGARRIDEWSRIEGNIPHLAVVPQLEPVAEAEDGGLDLLAPEWEVLAVIDGELDLRAIAATLGRSDFDVAKTVFGLHSAGIVRLHDPGAHEGGMGREPAEIEEAVERVGRLVSSGDVAAARAEVDTLLMEAPKTGGVQLAAALVGLCERRPAEAEDAARRALGIDPLLVEGHRLLGDALALQGKFGEAAEWWERWIALLQHEEEKAGDREQVAAVVEAARTLDEVVRGRYGE